MPSTRAEKAIPGRSASPSETAAHERRWSASDTLFRRWSTKRKDHATRDDEDDPSVSQRPSVLVRRHSSSAAKGSSAAKATAPSDSSRQQVKRVQRTAHKHSSDRKHSRTHKHRSASKIDHHDSSNVGPGLSKEKQSAPSDRPRLFSDGVHRPRFLRFLLSSSSSNRDKDKKEKSSRHSKHDKNGKQNPKKGNTRRSHSSPSDTKSKQQSSFTKPHHKHDKHSHTHRHRHRHHDETGSHRSRHNKHSTKKPSSRKATDGSKVSLNSTALSIERIIATRTREPTVRFSEPPEQHSDIPLPLSSGVLLPPAMPLPNNKSVISMPTPRHYSVTQGDDSMANSEHPEVTDLRLSSVGIDQHASDSRRTTILQPIPQRHYFDSKIPSRLNIASHDNTATVNNGNIQAGSSKKTDVEESEQQTVRVYRVIGRRNTSQQVGADIQNTDAHSPLLVTIAQDGSIVGGSSVKPADRMPSAFLPTLPTVSSESTETAPSHGTAPYQSALPVIDRPSFKQEEDVDNGSYCSSTSNSGSQSRTSRLGSDVSDIAMRRHLHVDEEGTHGAVAVDTPTDHTSDGPCSERPPDLHTVTDQPPPPVLWRQSYSLSQAFARSSSTAQQAHQYSPPPSMQRHYIPSQSQSQSHQNRAVVSPGLQQRVYSVGSPRGSDEPVVAQLLARVSDLETRFMCMEAIMTSIEEKLAGLTTAAAPTLSRSLSMKRMTTSLSAGKIPEIKRS
ncbi:hypothetical protein H4217_004860 [Coemansia sp. RSA 1939]|nr:hypothetical protein H4217_004860 [Coemansia sp. RSA 1939]KAJ2607171.1 hypothetical protein EV177_005669 [Coemansia sp. RSA 1804]